MPLTPQDFVSNWKRVTAREKQTYQEHFLDLCHLVDIKAPPGSTLRTSASTKLSSPPTAGILV